jgi:hypothetical protein
VSSLLHGKRITDVYGLTPEEYDRLLAFQGGACAICQNIPRTKRLAVDHDHKSGAVRGLLCRSCNYKVLGGVKDSVDTLQRAITYLQDPPAIALFKREIRP